jgi:hypothetical protein
VANFFRFGSLALTLALLAAIVLCSLAPSSHMTELAFIPQWLGDWADRNPNFRNFPVFTAFAAFQFLAFSFLWPQTGDCEVPTSDTTRHQPLAIRYRRWRLAFGVFVATALIGVVLELMQRTLPGRWPDPWDVMWSTLGSAVGTLCIWFLVRGCRKGLHITSSVASSSNEEPKVI